MTNVTLITGLPGNGKTLYAVSTVKALAQKEGRPVFYARIKGITLPWTQIDPFDWYKCPANSIIIIDECQKSNDPEDPKSPSFFGLRQRGAPVPIWASELETVRHRGVDLFLITQDPMLIDGHERKLCQRHLHFMRNFGLARSTIHEFTNGPRDNVAKSRTGSIKHEWKFPKEAYQWYQSAELHTVKRAIPARVWLLLSLPIFIVALLWFVWHRVQARIHGDTVPVTGTVMTSSSQAGTRAGTNQRPVQTAREYVDSYVPRVPGLAYTAPVYDEVTKPTEAPYPAAVIASKARCQAYTQQGTRLDLPETMCRQIASGGFFVAWQRPVVAAVPLASRLQPVQLAEPSLILMRAGGVPPAPVVAQTDAPDVRSQPRANRPPL